MLSFHVKTQRQSFQFLRFEERFRRAPYGDGLAKTAGLTKEIELCFQILSVWCRNQLENYQIVFNS